MSAAYLYVCTGPGCDGQRVLKDESTYLTHVSQDHAGQLHPSGVDWIDFLIDNPTRVPPANRNVRFQVPAPNDPYTLTGVQPSSLLRGTPSVFGGGGDMTYSEIDFFFTTMSEFSDTKKPIDRTQFVLDFALMGILSDFTEELSELGSFEFASQDGTERKAVQWADVHMKMNAAFRLRGRTFTFRRLARSPYIAPMLIAIYRKNEAFNYYRQFGTPNSAKFTSIAQSSFYAASSIFPQLVPRESWTPDEAAMYAAHCQAVEKLPRGSGIVQKQGPDPTNSLGSHQATQRAVTYAPSASTLSQMQMAALAGMGLTSRFAASTAPGAHQPSQSAPAALGGP